ncbi:alpha/beta hydrolase [Microcoleus sp. FACHB-672]|uniref:alpha/beta fold hydrolase n=1 Tax=Microcoleus sp. FACHB-672 TaxID=2692825 RepID=UPI0028168B28|nr:alpha/beta hydrolase [Microcoleus sp. FACHB-672]
MSFSTEDFDEHESALDPMSRRLVKDDTTSTAGLDFVDPATGRHSLDILYEQFAKPQLSTVLKPNEPSIYIRHLEGQEIAGGYKIEIVFEDPQTGFYAEGRVPLSGTNPPVLVIRGYGSWYPFEGVLEDTPDVFIAGMERHFKSAETQGAVDWLKQQSEAGNQADVIGESLGGKVAQQIAVKYPDCIRSTVTFNSLGVSQKLAETSQARNVFHYFTLGEKYAYWANQGEYIPGQFFQISKNGRSCRYKVEEALIWMGRFRSPARFHPTGRRRKMVLIALAQLILLNRHNELILNRRAPVVIKIERYP